MTGVYVKVVRGGKPETVEVEYLTDAEAQEVFGEFPEPMRTIFQRMRRACAGMKPESAPERSEILVVSIGPDNKMVVKCQPGAFHSDYQAGMMLAQVGRIVLEAIRKASGGNPGLMEQAMAEMTRAFVRDMELPDDPASVSQLPIPEPPPDDNKWPFGEAHGEP
jgi:hypothetical protein